MVELTGKSGLVAWRGTVGSSHLETNMVGVGQQPK